MDKPQVKIPYTLVTLGSSQPVLERVSTAQRQVATAAEIDLLGLLVTAGKLASECQTELQAILENVDMMLESPKRNKALEQVREKLAKIRLDLEKFPR